MTKAQAEYARNTGKRVNLKCYHGTFLNRQISRVYSTEDKYGKKYDLAELFSEEEKNCTIIAGVEDLSLAQ